MRISELKEQTQADAVGNIGNIVGQAPEQMRQGMGGGSLSAAAKAAFNPARIFRGVSTQDQMAQDAYVKGFMSKAVQSLKNAIGQGLVDPKLDRLPTGITDAGRPGQTATDAQAQPAGQAGAAAGQPNQTGASQPAAGQAAGGQAGSGGQTSAGGQAGATPAAGQAAGGQSAQGADPAAGGQAGAAAAPAAGGQAGAAAAPAAGGQAGAAAAPAGGVKASPNAAKDQARKKQDIQTINNAVSGIAKSINSTNLPNQKAMLARELVNVMADNKKARPEAWQNAYKTVQMILKKAGSDIDATMPKGRQNTQKDLLAALAAGQTRNQQATGISKAAAKPAPKLAKSSTAANLGRVPKTQKAPAKAAKPAQPRKVAEAVRLLDYEQAFWLNRLLEEIDVSWADLGYILLENDEETCQLVESKYHNLNMIFESLIEQDATNTPQQATVYSIPEWMAYKFLPEYLKGIDVSQAQQQIIQKLSKMPGSWKLQSSRGELRDLARMAWALKPEGGSDKADQQANIQQQQQQQQQQPQQQPAQQRGASGSQGPQRSSRLQGLL